MAGERFASRDAQIWELWVNGHSQPALAKRFNLSNQRISQIVAIFRESIGVEEKAEIVARSVGQLHWVEREFHAIAAAPPLPAYSNGRPILEVDPDTGEEKVAEDHSARMTALRELRATNESIRKLTGADAKVESSVTVQTSPELSALAEQARARRLAREPDEGAA